MKKIPRNRKIVPLLFASAHDVLRFDLDHYFVGQPSEPRWAQEALQNGLHTYLYQKSETRYGVHVHGNLWYEFDA